MAGPYRNNVVISAAGTSTFSPPLDAVYVTASSTTGQGASVTFTVNGDSATMPVNQLTAGTLIEVGGVTQISMSASNAFRYIGLRVANQSGSSNVTADSPAEGG